METGQIAMLSNWKAMSFGPIVAYLSTSIYYFLMYRRAALNGAMACRAESIELGRP